MKNNGYINHTNEIYRITIQDRIKEVSFVWRDNMKMRTGMDNSTNNIIKKTIKGGRVNNNDVIDISGVRPN